jgi:hypothetical protein
MLRASILLLVLSLGTSAPSRPYPLAWPHQALVTDPNGRSVPFRAITLGGDLMVNVARPGRLAMPKRLERGDTLRAVTPENYALDLSRGPVVFFTSGRDSIRIIVNRNPWRSIQVTGQGRRLSLRLVRDSIVISSR